MKIRILHQGREYETENQPGVLASELIRRQGLEWAMPCGGTGKCGKCKIKTTCESEPPQRWEQALLKDEEIASGLRLACYCRLLSSGDLLLPEWDAGGEILQWSRVGDSKGSTAANFAETAAAKGLEEYGFACDIGTTTVAAALYRLSDKRMVAEAAEPNCQKAYGGDVISRITACDEYGVVTLSNLMRNQLARMASVCLQQAAEAAEEAVFLKRAVITGNTVMLHILEGLNPHSLAVSPFTAQSLFGCESSWTLHGAPVYIPGCAGAYIGGDAVCAMLACGMRPSAGGTYLLADIGTNSEMALLAEDGRILCCSAPAGPAFEGAGISMGMNAAKGAVCQVALNNGGRVSLEIIGGTFPREALGLCGSGLLDCIAVMRELRVMDDTGALKQDFVLPGTSVKVTQQDVRQVQLAKAAVFAGIEILLKRAGIGAAEVDQFFVAGGFGTSMNLESAAAIGMIPSDILPRARFVGNGALAGAAMLLDESFRDQERLICGNAAEIHLAADPDFMNAYIEAMSF